MISGEREVCPRCKGYGHVDDPSVTAGGFKCGYCGGTGWADGGDSAMPVIISSGGDHNRGYVPPEPPLVPRPRKTWPEPRQDRLNKKGRKR